MTSNSRHRHRDNGGGFTLIEMIVVLLILSVTIALIAPRVGSGWKTIEDTDFLQEFVETIKRARLFAINSGRPSFGSRDASTIRNPPENPTQNAKSFPNVWKKPPRYFFITFYPDGASRQ